jgi:hypothetical protein
MPRVPCNSTYLVLSKKVFSTVILRVVPVRCKSWDCPRCALKKSEEYGRRISRFFVNKQLYFYTFTFKHDAPQEELWKKAASAWHVLHANIIKRYKEFSYVKILESHTKSCAPHYHICTPTRLSEVWLGRALRTAGFGWQAKMVRVNSSGINGYLRKYLTKSWPRPDSAEIRRKLKLRIVTFSQSTSVVDKTPSEWRWAGIYASRSEAIDTVLTMALFETRTGDTINETLVSKDIFEVTYRLSDSVSDSPFVGIDGDISIVSLPIDV